MAFSKYDPHKPEVKETDNRRARMLKVGGWISLIYTLIGFLFIGIVLVRGRLF